MQSSHRKIVGRAVTGTAALILATFASPAWAYLDPGTGSMIISAIVGLFATVGLAVKTYWYKLKALFRRDAPVAETAGEVPADEDAQPNPEAPRTPES
jgi:hypothetical protein